MGVYEDYRKEVTEKAKEMVKVYGEPKEGIPQNILWLKAALSDVLEESDIKNIYTFSNEETQQFGFSEAFVNQLMSYAFIAGEHRGTGTDTEQYNNGYNKAIAEIKGKLSDHFEFMYDED